MLTLSGDDVEGNAEEGEEELMGRGPRGRREDWVLRGGASDDGVDGDRVAASLGA